MKNVIIALIFMAGFGLVACESSSTQTNAGNGAENTPAVAKTPEELNKAKSIADWKNDIKNSPDWLAQCVQKAKDRKITLDSMIAIDAKASYEIYHNPADEQKKINQAKSLLDWENEIKSKPEAVEAIKKKAIAKGLSLDEMIKQDAQWLYDECRK